VLLLILKDIMRCDGNGGCEGCNDFTNSYDLLCMRYKVRAVGANQQHQKSCVLLLVEPIPTTAQKQLIPLTSITPISSAITMGRLTRGARSGFMLRPCPTPGLIQLLRLHRSSTAQLRSRITYSGHGHADIPPLSMTLGLVPTQSLLHLTVYPALT